MWNHEAKIKPLSRFLPVKKKSVNTNHGFWGVLNGEAPFIESTQDRPQNFKKKSVFFPLRQALF